MKKQIFLEWLQIAAGLAVFSLGVHLTIFANIGLAPWDCLGMGVAKHTPLNYGLSMTVMSVFILILDLLLKERIGFGTIIDALLTGNIIQFYNDINPFPMNESLPSACRDPLYAGRLCFDGGRDADLYGSRSVLRTA